LTSPQATRIDEIFRNFDVKRRPLHDQQIEYSRILRKAAEGDATAVQQVDSAIDGIFDIRLQLTQIDKEVQRYLAKELSPEQRAKLALVFNSIRDQLRQEIQKENQKTHENQKMRPAESRKTPEK